MVMTRADVLPRSEHLLVVEDDEFSQQLIGLYLRKAGFSEITVATDGRQALEIAKSREFDLVLLDLNLPRISGAEVLRRLRREGFLTDTPVIVISSIANMEETVQCLDLGAEDYLPKPFNVRLLEGRVSACLEKRRLKQEARAALDLRARLRQSVRATQAALCRLSLPPAGTGWPVEAAALMIPGAEPGGDFQAVFPLPDRSSCFLSGTVAEHGVSAALAMARVLAAVQGAIAAPGDAPPPDPGQVLEAVNEQLCRDLPGPAVTLLVGVIGRDGRTIRLASAGHPDPLLFAGSAGSGSGSGVETLPCERGRALGLRPEVAYASVDLPFEPGQLLIALTRGLPDATSHSGASLGEHHLKRAIGRCAEGAAAGAVPRDVTAQDVTTAIERALRQFIGPTAPMEDASALVLRALPGVSGNSGDNATTAVRA